MAAAAWARRAGAVPTFPVSLAVVVVEQVRRHSGAMRKHRTRDLEVPGSALRAAPEGHCSAYQAYRAAFSRHCEERSDPSPLAAQALQGLESATPSLRAKRSNPDFASWKDGLPRRFAPRNDGIHRRDIDMDGRWTCALVLTAGFSPELCNSLAPFIQRAQGKPGAGGTRY